MSTTSVEATALLKARALLPFLLTAAQDLPADDPRTSLIAELQEWDGQMLRSEDGRASAPAVAIFRTWVDTMVRDVLMDDQPAIDPTVLYNRISRPVQILRDAILGEDAGVSQTHDFFNGEDKAQVMLEALDKTRQALAKEYDSESIDDWRVALPQHGFATVNYLGIPQAGRDEDLSIGTAMSRGTQNNLITFKDGSVTVCMVNPPGQSGFVSLGDEKSPHYDDQLALYGNFECRPQALLKEEIQEVEEESIPS